MADEREAWGDMADKAVRVPVEYFIDKFWPIPHASGPSPIPTHNPFAKAGRLNPKTATEDEYSAAFVGVVMPLRCLH